MDPLERAAAQHQAGIELHERGEDAEAEIQLAEALASFERHAGSTEDLANVLLGLGMVRRELGRFDTARQALDRAAALLHTEDDAEAVATLAIQIERALGELLIAEGRYGDAERLLGAAVVRAKSRWGSDHAEVLDLLNSRGVALKHAGRYDEAELAYEESFEILTRCYGPEHPGQATAYHNLAGLAHAQGEFVRGESLARKGIALRERDLGTDNVRVAEDRAVLGALLIGQQRFEDAEVTLRQAIEVFTRPPDTHPYDAAVAIENLGSALAGQLRYDDAMRAYERALAIKTEVFGDHHAEVGVTLHNIGSVFSNLGRVTEARQSFIRAETLFTTTLGPDHPHTETTRQARLRLPPEDSSTARGE